MLLPRVEAVLNLKFGVVISKTATCSLRADTHTQTISIFNIYFCSKRYRAKLKRYQASARQNGSSSASVFASSKLAVVTIKWTSITFYDMYLSREIILPILEMAYFRFKDIYDVISVIFDENT